MADVLTLAAGQVRFLGRTAIHTVAAEWTDPLDGRMLRTLCCRVLPVATAIRTTAPANCAVCVPGGL